MFGKIFDAIAGNPDSDKMNSLINQGMGQYTGGLNKIAGQMGQLGTQSMAAQQGMGGSGLLQQATQNQAYSNMMGAGQKGLQAFMNQQKLGAGYLQQQGNLLGQAGSMQSDLNTSMANVESDRAANRGAMIQGGIGLASKFINPV